MSSPPPRRPSPGPRPSPAGRPRPRPRVDPLADPVAAAPGRAGWLSRRPTARALSIGAITAGVAVFVASSVITPLAGADTAARHPRHRHDAAAHEPAEKVLRDVTVIPPATDTTVPASSSSLLTKRGAPASARSASVDHTVISGLAANGIPSVALNAYRVAAARVDNDDPSCGIQWSLLAGIGREESDHGQFGGAVLHSDGLSTPEIIGPALNGKGNQYIPAPPNGMALDGDAVYAHALGPMQFIPSTWAIYGTDADGDGHANIFDINDAALATARYLCAAGGNLTTRAGRVRAVFAYNHTAVYVAQVLALAHAYKTGTPVTGLPRGNTTGSLPGLGHAGTATPPTKSKQKTTKTTKSTTTKAPSQPPLHLGGASSTPTSTPSSPTHSPKPSPSPTPSPSKSRTPTPSPSPSGSSSTSSCPLICLP